MLKSIENLWKISLVFFLQANCAGPCIFKFDSQSGKTGNFSSPNYPELYPEDIECYYQFIGQNFEALRITFHNFELEKPYPKGCLTDYVDISTITAYQVKLLVGRFCGSDLPKPIQTMHPSAEIIFKSNHVVQRKGFHGRYEFRDESEVEPAFLSTPGVEGCGGVLTGVGGIIVSPGYPNSFPKDVECVWLVRVDNSRNVYVRILELELYGSIANCAEAELAVFDGYYNLAYNPKVLKRYCGDLKYYKNVEEQTQMSARNRVLIRFRSRVTKTSNEDDPVVGFKLVWTGVKLTQKGKCEQFHCKGSQYCIHSISPHCTETHQYCIDQSLVCDGIPNCSDEDYSDEDKCNLPLLAGCGAGIAGLLLVICVGIAVYRRGVRVRKSFSQAQALSTQLRQMERSPSYPTSRTPTCTNYYASSTTSSRSPEMSSSNNCALHTPHPYDLIENSGPMGASPHRLSYPTDV